jgi:hypothetical protein
MPNEFSISTNKLASLNSPAMSKVSSMNTVIHQKSVSSTITHKKTISNQLFDMKSSSTAKYSTIKQNEDGNKLSAAAEAAAAKIKGIQIKNFKEVLKLGNSGSNTNHKQFPNSDRILKGR